MIYSPTIKKEMECGRTIAQRVGVFVLHTDNLDLIFGIPYGTESVGNDF